MIIDLKQHPDSSKEKGTLPPSAPVPAPSSSVAQRKLAVELPTPRQIYTTGSTVTGIVRLGTKDLESIEQIQVSLVCTVRTIHHRYYGGTSHDYRRETTKLFHRDQTLWSRAPGDTSSPSADISFSIVIPEVGNDPRGNDPNAPLPPSFEAGGRTGWAMTPIGFVKYHIKASVERKGSFRFKERAFQPFIFLPPSSAPPLLPPIPESISYESLDTLESLWQVYKSTSKIRHGIFSSMPPAQALTTLWLPDVQSFPRLTKIPFFLCLTIRSNPGNKSELAKGSPPKDIPEPKLDKAYLHLRRTIRACARRGVQYHTRTFDKQPTDNFLHGLTFQESDWSLKNARGGETAFWEKGYLWRGLWTFKEAPNFVNRQLRVTYTLVAEVPIKGIGNDAKLVSRNLDISSGIIRGDNAETLPVQEMMGEDFPPDYFDDNEGDGEDDHEEENEKA
ncbi:hypothetical protein BU17DRAFT_98383 [Hysterangium stoloniferum]|nr:hypothetical protein BU17DRAFT_98383 [Hysterangium stoloniferum]